MGCGCSDSGVPCGCSKVDERKAVDRSSAFEQDITTLQRVPPVTESSRSFRQHVTCGSSDHSALPIHIGGIQGRQAYIAGPFPASRDWKTISVPFSSKVPGTFWPTSKTHRF